MFAADPLRCTLNALGRQHVMFSADYPFESVDEAAAFIDHVALDAEVREDICFRNAQQVLRL
jgi:2,3-dihydroxybenzoate decarboxylase